MSWFKGETELGERLTPKTKTDTTNAASSLLLLRNSSMTSGTPGAMMAVD